MAPECAPTFFCSKHFLLQIFKVNNDFFAKCVVSPHFGVKIIFLHPDALGHNNYYGWWVWYHREGRVFKSVLHSPTTTKLPSYGHALFGQQVLSVVCAPVDSG